MCDTKFSIYLYSVRFGIRACEGGHVSLGFSMVGVFKHVWYGFFLSACYQHGFILFLYPCFCHFLCFTCKDIRSDWMISLLVACLAILGVNRVLLSESLKLFSLLSRRMLRNLICLFLVLAKRFLLRQALSFLWLSKIQHAGLMHGFQVSLVACLFVIVWLFLYLPLY